VQWVAGLSCALLYTFLAIRSNCTTGIDLPGFLVGYWLIAAVLFLYWYYLFDHDLDIRYRDVIGWAIVFRLLGIYGSPILEDDFYRYLLDGCLFWSSASPYGISPESLFQANSLSSECRDALIWVNNPHLPTVYGPVLQYTFALAHLMSPANIVPLQVILAGVDIGIILLLCKLARAREVLLYAWNPLVLKEAIFTAHPDVIGIFFLLVAFFARSHHRTAIACLFVALACATKVFALLALPFFLYQQKMRYWILTATVMGVLYLPFIMQGQTDLPVLGKFMETWIFNATAFRLAAFIFPDLVARLVCLGAFVLWWCCYFFHYQKHAAPGAIPRMDWIFALFFLLSPVTNAWYIVWLLPFAVIRPSCWPWATSVAVSLTYVTGLHWEGSELGAYQIADWAFALEVVLILAAVCHDFRNHRLTFNAS